MKRTHNRKTLGFTMIEMIIAITLLSMLTVGFFMALRIGLTALERTSVRMDEDRRVIGVQRILDHQAAGIIPAMASCAGSRRAPIFNGTANMLQLVSTHSLAGAGRGFPQLLEYMIVPGEQAGSLRLVVNETPYAGAGTIAGLCLGAVPNQVFLRPPVLGPRSFVLADRLAAARFSYLYENAYRGQREWRPTWQPSDTIPLGAALPTAIRIDMASLATEPAHMRMAPITLRVRVNRMTRDEYIYDDVEPPPRPLN